MICCALLFIGMVTVDLVILKILEEINMQNNMLYKVFRLTLSITTSIVILVFYVFNTYYCIKDIQKEYCRQTE
ncbi:hypothetical protein MmiAt1_02770 [Methanimicrococcus sp. At1]|uniref:Uncharacterized protein n=1 Tax=Methanimicrococcus hacksteinii TaxID=3028293 RepID=A0ABU3VNG6_9EURY|nr:hypothetical protein [Methanimicrococcus sp. At1]